MNVTQDVTLWMTDVLHKALTKVIMAKENHPRVYYILVIAKDYYMGPSARRTNRLINKKLINKNEPDVKTIDLSGKHVVHNRIVCMDNQPPVPMIGTSLWRIDNKIGEARCIYILPPDKPMITGNEMGEASKFIWKSAQGAPLIWSIN